MPTESFLVSAAMLTATRIARSQGGGLTYQQALAAGVTRSQIRAFVARGWWLHLGRDAYVVRAAIDHGDNPISALQTRARAAVLGRPSAIICGITAARILGFGSAAGAADEAPVHLLVPHRGTRPSARGLRLIPDCGTLPGQITRVAGLPLTAPARTLADVVLAAQSREDAVSLMDGALHAGLVTDLDEAIAATVRRRGRHRVAPWWSLADGRSESVLETRARLVLVDNDLRPEQLQWQVHDEAGRFVARVDIAYPSWRVAVEVDGAKAHGGLPAPAPSGAATGMWLGRDPLSHATPARYGIDPLFRDRRRQNALTSLGWRVVRVTWPDVVASPGEIIRSVRQTLGIPAP